MYSKNNHTTQDMLFNYLHTLKDHIGCSLGVENCIDIFLYNH